MAEIEITLPTVQYGNVKVRATPEELGVDISSPAAVGTATAIYLNLFTQGFKVGASMDVTASPTEGLKAPLAAEQGEVDRVIDETLKAAQMLSEGLGGATEVPAGGGVAHLDYNDDGPGDVQAAANEARAPWSEPVTDAKPKPWETEGW